MAVGPWDFLAPLLVFVRTIVDALAKTLFGGSRTEAAMVGSAEAQREALAFQQFQERLLRCSLPSLPVVDVRRSGFARAAAEQAPEDIRGTLERLVALACAAPGRCAFVVAPQHAFQDAQDSGLARFRLADASFQWPRGYMNMRLRHARVEDEDFASAVFERSMCAEDSVWPDDHEARGLSTDGFTALVDNQGCCLSAGVHIEGVRSSPYQWGSVGINRGMLHSTALGICWLLREHHAAVVVRSASARTVHVLLPDHSQVKAFRCEIPPSRAASK